VLGLAERFYDDATAKIDFLANNYPTAEQLKNFFASLYPDPIHSENRRAKNVRGTLFRLFESGVGQDMPEVRHTAWAAFNAVTEYVDHMRPSRGSETRDRAGRRLDSAWFGSGAKLKARAWDLALAMADGN
jgi:hypothetical protein